MTSILGNKINARRRDLKLSIDKLAELSGTSKSYIWELENRENPNPSAEKIESIAKALSVTSQFLLESKVENPDEEVIDEAFFRKYKGLSDNDKKKMRKLIDVWDDED
ncbi:helix-turn-helix domain-containing protein [Pantoea sp. Mb-10]|uniref:helix-turn-helix domain-containing protein n=1 Tax=unclassified Pantoea TaxID=2630326 RepID=UPI001E2BDB13|nr:MULTISPECIES: helix-turn-helix transcriptional regulator [unclassified Pantoea]MCE0490334.1 helix-turn-helix domain-containing protein [Pantoea sp. Mb-10]MCE0501465.1 helix-turn-helix domain-containing protein [Pantoea sp. Pb-8]